MMTLREQAEELLRELPDEKMADMVEAMRECTENLQNAKIHDKVLAAWNELQKFKGVIHCDIDIKKELAEARDKKYANNDFQYSY